MELQAHSKEENKRHSEGGKYFKQYETNRDYDTCGIAIGGESMSKIKEKDIREIRRAVEKEFPEDPALQQVHIARKIVAKEAQLEGLSFLEYVKLLGKKVKNVTQRHGV